jgi:succinoglycan biosynthesis protein ExoA
LWACSSNLRDLAHQYRRYGRGKCRVALAHPRSLSPRHMVPPVGVAVVLASLLAMLLFGSIIPAITILLYMTFLIASVGSAAARTLPLRLRLLFPVVIAVMHSSQGVGFLIEFARLSSGRQTLDRYRPRDLAVSDAVDRGSRSDSIDVE